MASSNDTNDEKSAAIQDIIKILPKHEQTVQVKMQPLDSRNNRPSSNNHNNALYHTLRYDFKPASINSDEPASLELGKDGQVTIKAPNVGGSICTFKGQRRPHVKECLMIIDNRTGEVVLQKLTDNITVKATRTMAGNGPTNAGSAIANGGGGGSNSSASSNSNSGPGPGSSGSGSAAAGAIQAGQTSTTNTTTVTSNINDGPQLSEESSDSSDESSSCSSSSGSSSVSSSSSSASSSSNNQKGFTF